MCFGSADITTTLFALDGTALNQKAVARRLSKLFVNVGGSKSTAKSYTTQIDKLYVNAWALAWSVPKVIVTCSNTEFCAKSDNTNIISAYSQNVEGLNSLSRKIGSAILKKTKVAAKRRLTKKLVAQAKALRDQGVTDAQSVPATTSSCAPATV